MTTPAMDNVYTSTINPNKTDTDIGLDGTSTSATGCSVVELSPSPALSYGAIALGVFLILENSVLFGTICRTRSLHTNTNILVASLAVTDVLMGFMSIIGSVYGLTGGYKVWFGSNARGQRLLDSFIAGEYFGLVSISISHLALLAVDRYLFVKWPFRYAQAITKRRVIATAVILWSLGLTYLFLPMLILHDPKYHEKCLFFNIPFFYGGGPLLVVYTTSFVIVLGSTAGMARLALNHRRRRDKMRVVRLGWLSPKPTGQAGQRVEDRTPGVNAESATVSGTKHEAQALPNSPILNNGVCETGPHEAGHTTPQNASVSEIDQIMIFTTEVNKHHYDEKRLRSNDTKHHYNDIFVVHNERDSNSNGRDSNSNGRDSNSHGRDSNSYGRDSYSNGRDSNSNRCDSNSNGRDSNSNGRDSNSHGRDSNINGRDQNNHGHDSNSNGRDSNSHDQSQRNSHLYNNCKAISNPHYLLGEKNGAVSLLGVRHITDVAKISDDTNPNSQRLKTEPWQASQETKIQEIGCNNDTKSKNNNNNVTDDKVFTKANMKIMKFILIVFGIFFICTFPPLVTFNLPYVTNRVHGSSLVNRVMGFFLFSNSGMNFVIFAYMNKEFRAAVVSSWLCRVFNKK